MFRRLRSEHWIQRSMSIWATALPTYLWRSVHSGPYVSAHTGQSTLKRTLMAGATAAALGTGQRSGCAWRGGDPYLDQAHDGRHHDGRVEALIVP